jgi:hypothetical protein
MSKDMEARAMAFLATLVALAALTVGCIALFRTNHPSPHSGKTAPLAKYECKLVKR